MASIGLEAALVASTVSLVLVIGLSDAQLDSNIATCLFGGAIGFLWLVVRRAVPAEGKGNGSDQAAVATGFTENLPSPDQVTHLIESRRSIHPKNFSGEPVDRETVEKLLQAANWAPTHNVTEAWRFVVLSGEARSKFEQLSIDMCAKYLPEDQASKTVAAMKNKAEKVWPKVSQWVVVVARLDAHPTRRNPEWEEVISVGYALQNFCLLATSLGVATFHSSWKSVAFEAQELRDFLGLGMEDRCLGVIVVGKSDKTTSLTGRRGPWQDKVTWIT